MTKLTTSEARAEAVSIVLQILLAGRPDCARLYEQAQREARTIGRAEITEEVAWLFADLPQACADMLVLDDCS